MIRRIHDGYIYSTAVILFVTAMILFSSALGSAPILDWLDPLLPFSNRRVFVLAGIMGLGFSAYLFLENERGTKIMSIAWLAIIYLIYRLGLWWAGAVDPSKYLGIFNDQYSISPEVVNRIAWVWFGWLFVGSHTLGIFQWLTHLSKRKPETNPT